MNVTFSSSVAMYKLQRKKKGKVSIGRAIDTVVS
jgi:hypothetical protein